MHLTGASQVRPVRFGTMDRITRRLALAAATVAIALVAAGCGGDEGSSGSADAASSSAVAAASSVQSAASSVEAAASSVVDAATSAAASGKVDANTASVAELAAAFTAAGIPNAEKWAHEVEEYRPYDAADTEWTHLRDELAKYNPDPAVVDQIVATLEP